VVAAGVRKMSDATATLIASGVGIVGVVVGVMVGLFGERWLRRWGDVECRIKEDDWYVPKGAYPRGGDTPGERRLRATFTNGKELPVTVWDVRVDFYKGRELLEEWAERARPRVQLVEESHNISELRAVILPPHIPVSLEIRVTPLGAHDTDQEQAAKLRVLEEAERAEFVANLIDARDKRMELAPPWRQ
jgi:hypothetical protein